MVTLPWWVLLLAAAWVLLDLAEGFIHRRLRKAMEAKLEAQDLLLLAQEGYIMALEQARRPEA